MPEFRLGCHGAKNAPRLQNGREIAHQLFHLSAGQTLADLVVREQLGGVVRVAATIVAVFVGTLGRDHECPFMFERSQNILPENSQLSMDCCAFFVFCKVVQ